MYINQPEKNQSPEKKTEKFERVISTKTIKFVKMKIIHPRLPVIKGLIPTKT